MMSCVRSQNGNVLFLILIAVALFAALSYAVTQSTRSGSKDSSSEQLQLNYSRAESYISSLRSAITRMVINGTPIEDINFYAPSQFSTLTPTQLSHNVFHPTGGGLPYQEFTDRNAGFIHIQFVFAEQIENIGSTTTDDKGNEILIGFALTNEAFCKYVNKKIGYTGAVPALGGFIDDWTGPLSLTENGGSYRHMVADYSMPTDFTGKTEGCAIDGPSGDYVFYATIAER